jgi:hypothetical protein
MNRVITESCASVLAQINTLLSRIEQCGNFEETVVMTGAIIKRLYRLKTMHTARKQKDVHGYTYREEVLDLYKNFPEKVDSLVDDLIKGNRIYGEEYMWDIANQFISFIKDYVRYISAYTRPA